MKLEIDMYGSQLDGHNNIYTCVTFIQTLMSVLKVQVVVVTCVETLLEATPVHVDQVIAWQVMTAGVMVSPDASWLPNVENITNCTVNL